MVGRTLRQSSALSVCTLLPFRLGFLPLLAPELGHAFVQLVLAPTQLAIDFHALGKNTFLDKRPKLRVANIEMRKRRLRIEPAEVRACHLDPLARLKRSLPENVRRNRRQ